MVSRSKPIDARKRRRRMTLLWSAIVALVIILLLRYQQIALLYVLATLSVTALLIIVALADLSGPRKAGAEVAPADDSAAIGDRTSSPLGSPVLSQARGSRQR